MINSKDGIPEREVVGTVLDKVKAEGGPAALDANAENVREALRQMKIMDVVQGKAGVGGQNKKDMGEHKVVLGCNFMFGMANFFCTVVLGSTQPVPQIGVHLV